MHAARGCQHRNHVMIADFLGLVPSAPSIGLAMAVGADTFEIIPHVILTITVSMLQFKGDWFAAPLCYTAVIACAILFSDNDLSNSRLRFAFKHIASIPAETVLLII